MSSLVPPLLLSALHDVRNYSMWFPVEHRHELHLMPPISLWDLHYGVYCAVVMALLRYLLLQPLLSWLAVRWMSLPRHSLAELNTRRAAAATGGRKQSSQQPTRSDFIPPFVFPLLSAFLESQAAIMKKAKRSGNAAVVLEGKLRSQKQWKETERRIMQRLQADAASASASAAYSDDDVKRWLSLYQRDASRSLKVKKFVEAGWQLLYYGSIWCYELLVLSDKPYALQSVHLVWSNYPLQPPSADVAWLYWLSIGHYLHLLCTSFFDIRRKDFAEMLVHHVVTLLLLSFSWMVNFSRIGALVLAVHDGCDVFLLLAKLLNYCRQRTLTDLCFVAFALCFFVCRLVIFPFRIIYTSLVWTVTVGGYRPWFVYYFFNGLLLSLLLLHSIWFSMIASMAWRWITTGEMKKDARSDTDDGSASEHESSASAVAATLPAAAADRQEGVSRRANGGVRKKDS